MLKPGGKVGIYGVLKKGGGSLDLFKLPNNAGVHLLNWPYHEHRTHEAVLDMVLKGQVRLTDFYSHVLPCDEAAHGFDLIEKREAYKVIFTF
jgi:threonine dehydrogenase-like Zn-dependent dehydrogenase